VTRVLLHCDVSPAPLRWKLKVNSCCFNEGVARRGSRAGSSSVDEESLGQRSANDATDESETDDYLTPPDTPPSELDLDDASLQQDVSVKGVVVDGRSEQSSLTTAVVTNDSDSLMQERLGEEILKERMYEQYHLNFSELQVCSVFLLFLRFYGTVLSKW